jgi:hypothetical protein
MPSKRALKKKQQQQQQQQQQQSGGSEAREQRGHGAWGGADDDDGRDDDDDDDDENDEDEDTVRLAVRPSTISGGGDGLFLASRFASKGTVLLAEDAVPIRRKDARKILDMPQWRNQHPLIQCNKDVFLDIRELTLYKSNHAEEDQCSCNAAVAQTSERTLTMTARRDIHRGEELMWQYAKNWLAGYTPS